MSGKPEDETDFSLKAVSRGGTKEKTTKSESGKSMLKQEGSLMADTVPTSVSQYREESALDTALAADQYNYSFSNGNRGTCIVFNNMQFDQRTGQTLRTGSDLDAAAVKVTFEMLQFDVHTYENSTCLQMWDIMRNESERDHRDEDCFVCVILSHGAREAINEDGKSIEKDVIYGKDNFMFLEQITQHLSEENCPSLAGKPKIFIIQACRGHDLSEAVEFEEVTAGAGDKTVRPTDKQRMASYHENQKLKPGYDEADAVASQPVTSVPQDLPIDVDCLLVYASPPGFFSFRGAKGSFFIKAICEQLRRHHTHKDLMSIMTRVNHQVAFQYESYAPSSRTDPKRRDIHEKKQMPWVASKLTKFVYFRDV